MCGIAGIIRFAGSKVEKHELKIMTDTIAHRGPDGEGQWVDDTGKVGLGHRRLSIIDLSEKGNQPMHYRDRYHLVFNGEIYNYIEIRDRLRSDGYSFSSESDTEVLIAAYDQRGDECLKELDGMFAFVLYDRKKERIFCARDRFGEKPFYYYFDGKTFLFASEMKAIWAAGIEKILNNKTVHNYLITGRNQGVRKYDTFYDSINQLMASHSMTIDINNPDINQKRYWKLDTTITNISADEAIEQFDYLFKESVNRRLRSDVPVGSSLSGGLDSSMVVGYMADNKNIRQNTFSASFPGFAKDEGRFQRMMVDRYQTTHHNTSPGLNSSIKNLDRIVHHQEEPFGSMSLAIQYEVFKLARSNNVSVLLDGQGADEILGGYSFFTFSYLMEKLRKGNIFDFINSARLAGDRQAKSSVYFIGGTLSRFLPGALTKRFKSADVETAISLLNPDFASKFKIFSKSDIKIYNSLNESLDDRLTDYGLDQLLRFSDRNAMAHGVEVRLPFLYHELVEFIFSLPSDLKIHMGWTKWIARKVAEKKVPNEIVWRKEKIAYESPDNFLFNNQNEESIISAINNPDLNKYFKKGVKINDPKLFFRKLIVSKILQSGHGG